MRKSMILTITALAMVLSPISAKDAKGVDKKGAPEIENQQPQRPNHEDNDKAPHKLIAAGKNNCPIYYGCPAPVPAPAPAPGGNGGGGKGGVDNTQPHA